MSEAGPSREELPQSGSAPERGPSQEEVANPGLTLRGNEGKIGGELGKGDGQGVLTQMEKEGAWPKSALVQEEGGEGVPASTSQLGPLPQPGMVHRENNDGVLKQTGVKTQK